jgi:hypothetical protein
MSRRIQTSTDGNGKGMDNSFPDGDNAVTGSPFTIGTSATTIELDGTKPTEIMVYVDGDESEKCYVTFSETRNASATDDFPFTVGSIFSVPNTGTALKAIGSNASIKLRMFYSMEV